LSATPDEPSPANVGEGQARPASQGEGGRTTSLEFAKRLRRTMTPAERVLWEHLRAKRFEGVKFKRQVPIGPFVVDFMALEHQLAIEVDGPHHGEEQASYDARRTRYLVERGLRVMRFSNDDIMTWLPRTLDQLRVALPLPGADAPVPLPPLAGEGEADRLTATFARVAAAHRAALVTFVTAGDPSPAQSVPILSALVEGGADIVELGMPFSDPMADGPSIQASSLRALGEGMTLATTLAQAAAFRAVHPATPLILMGYLNPIIAHGPARFAADALAAGVDGVIVVDLPPEEAPDLVPHLAQHGLHLIRLATPTTDAARLPAVLAGASGFLYYVSVAGITGAGSATADTIGAAIARLKAATDLPIAVGFGIRTPEQAAAVARHADAVVVGSAIVDTIARVHAARANDIAGPVREQVAALAAAIRTARA